MTVYEAINLLISFNMLIVTIIALSYTFSRKK